MTKLRLWQRIAISLIAYPLIYLIIPVPDVMNFFIASLLFSAILLTSAKWKDKEKEILPEWEDEDLEEKDNQIEEPSRRKT
jgi:hypothetical protein